MKYHKIRKMDIANGPGVRVSIFFQGCAFHCKNCFNPETHDFNQGIEFTEKTIMQIIKLCQEDYIKGLSILGGEPLHPININGTKKLVQKMKEKYPNKTIWLWTGYKIEKIEEKEILNKIDVLIDGPFEEELYDPNLKWKGSKNQRVIDLNRSRQTKKLELYETEKESIK